MRAINRDLFFDVLDNPSITVETRYITIGRALHITILVVDGKPKYLRVITPSGRQYFTQ